MKLLLSVFAVTCLICVVVATTTVGQAQETTSQQKQAIIKNVLTEMVVAKHAPSAPFLLLTPSDLAKLSVTQNNSHLSPNGGTDPCNTAVPIVIGQTLGGTLSDTDCRLDDNTYADFYLFDGVQGQPVTISMNSSDVDSYLGLANMSGTFTVEDDDSGGGWTALIRATLPETGQYLILANAVAPYRFGGYTLHLSGIAPCSYTVTPTSATVPATGGTFSFNVDTQPECFWQAFPLNSFTATSSSGRGPGTVTYTVSTNGSGATRTGDVIVSSAPLVTLYSYFTITQPSIVCNYSLSPSSVNLGSAQTSGSFQITAPAGCPWSVQSTSYFVTAAGSGSGSGTVTYSIAQNNGAARVGTITVANQTFLINQAGMNCTFALSPREMKVGRRQSRRYLTVDTQPGCTWTASSNGNYLTLLNNSGSGPGRINFTIAALTDSPRRSAAIQVFYQGGSTAMYLDQDLKYADPIADFDGDGYSDVSVFRPSNGVWYINSSSEGFSAAQFGVSEDKPVIGDFDGDGKTDLAVFRPSNGTWYLLQSRQGFAAIQFGLAGDIPTPADYDGDGKTDLAVFRPLSGVWYSLLSSQGFAARQFGVNGDIPVAGDYDADGKADHAVFRPSNGVWYLLNSTAGFSAIQFGQSGDEPVKGDFDGDGRYDLTVFRPSSGVWYRFFTTSNSAFATQFGMSGDVPVSADYDGDGVTDLAVFRPSNGVWYLKSSTQGLFALDYSIVQFGLSEDVPTPAKIRQ